MARASARTSGGGKRRVGCKNSGITEARDKVGGSGNQIISGDRRIQPPQLLTESRSFGPRRTTHTDARTCRAPAAVQVATAKGGVWLLTPPRISPDADLVTAVAAKGGVTAVAADAGLVAPLQTSVDDAPWATMDAHIRSACLTGAPDTHGAPVMYVL